MDGGSILAYIPPPHRTAPHRTAPHRTAPHRSDGCLPPLHIPQRHREQPPPSNPGDQLFEKQRTQ